MEEGKPLDPPYESDVADVGLCSPVDHIHEGLLLHVPFQRRTVLRHLGRRGTGTNGGQVGSREHYRAR